MLADILVDDVALVLSQLATEKNALFVSIDGVVGLSDQTKKLLRELLILLSNDRDSMPIEGCLCRYAL